MPSKCRAVRPLVRSVWNQSVMELGAMVCTAKSPLCEACPISPDDVRFYATDARDWGSGVHDHANDSKVRIGRCAGWC